jgi:steroid 5-alpha reductase family enzyme
VTSFAVEPFLTGLGLTAMMAWFLMGRAGRPLLEKQRVRSKPGDHDMRRTSGFIPLPPKRV